MQIPVSVSALDRPAFDRTQLCLFTCAINLWHQKLVTADITAVFVNSQHDIKRPGQDFNKRKFVFEGVHSEEVDRRISQEKLDKAWC